MCHTLLIAYGNPSRRDDGLAFHILLNLRTLFDLEAVELLDLTDGELLPGLQAIYAQQLIPEMSEALSKVQVAIFIDAHVADAGWPPIYWQETTPRFEAGMVSHHFTPDTLLAWSVSLFGRAPRAFTLSVEGVDFDFGYELAPQTAVLADQAAALLAEKIKHPDRL